MRMQKFLWALALCLVLLTATALAADEHDGHSAEDGWTELTADTIANNTLATGKYCLADDVEYTGSGPLTVNGTVTLCLNGYVLDLNGRHIEVKNGGNLTLCDCSEEETAGYIDSSGLWHRLEEGGTVPDGATPCNLTGGVITGGDSSGGDSSGEGGGVYVDGGSFTMEGGNIAGNTAKHGGGVSICGSTGSFTLSDGSITGNTADYGGGLYVNSSTVTLSGGSITHNTTPGYGGGVYVYGGGTVTMGDGTIAENSATAHGGGVYVEKGSFTMEGGSITGNAAGSSITGNAGSSGGGVYVKDTFTLSGGIITGNRAYSGGGVHVYGDGTVTMESGSITDNIVSDSGGGVYVEKGGYTKEGGNIAGNTAPGSGGGVYVKDAFTLSGGSITGNAAESSGGGVYVEKGSFTMEGGSITGNAAESYGGGVYVYESGTVTLSGGSITIVDNTLTDMTTASNVYLYENKTITIGGVLTNNESIGVTLASPGAFTDRWSTYMQGENPAEYFSSDNTAYGVLLNNSGEAQIGTWNYQVTFNANGGEGAMANQLFLIDQSQTLAPNRFTRTGYTFAGWNTAANGTGTTYRNGAEVENLTAENKGTVTLYAQWEINRYTVTFVSNGGSGTMGAQEFTYNQEQALTANAFTRSGYTFAGWNTEADGSGDSYSDGQTVSNLTEQDGGTVTLYAQWTAIPFSGGTAPVRDIAVDSGSHGDVEIWPEEAKQGTTVTITADPDKGYEVDEVIVTDGNGTELTVTDKGNGKYTFMMPGGDVTIEVTFQPVSEESVSGGDLTITAPAGWVNPYGDVAASAWYYDAVGYASANGLMGGVGGSAFDPEGSMNRAMVWTVIARLAGQTISGGSWAEDARAWAVAQGVSDGTNPDGAVSREELVTMLYRYAGSPEMNVPELALTGGYPDSAAMSAWAQNAFAWALSRGIIDGRDGLLAAGESVKRAEAATMLARFCELVK